jgi:alcohol dehydrogenase class IV
MQKEFSGRGCSSKLLLALQAIDASNVLLVTGKNSYDTSGAREIFADILGGYQVTRFNQFSSNPLLEEAIDGARLCRESAADVVVAVGGGSAIDIAKCIAAFVAVPGRERELVTGIQALDVPTIPIVAIPTTAGTGSEATHFAVIYADGKKYSLASPHLLPNTALLDSRFTDHLPAAITASTGFDALCQAIESFWSIGATDTSRTCAEAAIKALLEYLPIAVNSPGKESRDAVFRAANLAGKAINISKTTAPHALSYTITSLYGIPHGHAVAMTLGAFFTLHDPARHVELTPGISRNDFLETNTRLLELMGVTSNAEATRYWYDLMARCGLNLCLGEVAIVDAPDLEKIVSSVNVQRLSNHPLKLDGAQLLELLRTIPTK